MSLYEPEYPDCTIITNFNLVTIDPPSFVVPTPLEECDDDYDGIVSFFDLSQKTEEILNGQTGISVSYHETLKMQKVVKILSKVYTLILKPIRKHSTCKTLR